MSDHIPEATKMVCPHCGAGVFLQNRLSVEFNCFTVVSDGKTLIEGRQCLRVQRDGLVTEVATLRTANKALVEQLAAYKAVVEDPAALWANWLRKTVKLPAGIGDVRQLEERVKRLEEAGNKLSAAFQKEWLTDGDIEAIQDDWEKSKEEKP